MKALHTPALVRRNNINIVGEGDQCLMLAHGFGCDQQVWDHLLPHLPLEKFKVILFDYVGSGESDLSTYDPQRYRSLEGYAQDLIEICDALELKEANFVGHSVSGIIGLIASVERPDLFAKQVMVCPSPCFLNDPPDYQGGFERTDLEELIELMDRNYIGWANYLAPIAMGRNPEDSLTEELADKFCKINPLVSKNFAQATFLLDYRHLLPKACTPTLLLQSERDPLAPLAVTRLMHDKMPGSTLEVLPTTGHCIHMSDPERLSDLLEQYLL